MKTRAALLCAMLATAGLTTLSTQALAEPKVSGQIGARVLKLGDQDLSVQAYDVRLGVSGQGKFGNVVAIYQLEAELTSASNNGSATPDGGEEIDIRSARILFPTKRGIFVIAPTTASGQQIDLYGAVDIFETNEAHSTNGVSGIFGQPETSSHVLAYVTPTAKGVRAVLAYLTGPETNGVDGDYLAWRATWRGSKNPALKDSKVGGLMFGVGQVFIDKAALPDGYGAWSRTTFTTAYDFSGFHFGMTYELYDRGNIADQTNYGVVLSYKKNGWTGSIGQFERDVDGGTDGDNSGTVLGITKAANEQLSFFAEVGAFDADDEENVSLGVKLKF